MEAHLDRLLHDNVGLAAKAQAATGLHQRELEARQQAQVVVARLRRQLQALQASEGLVGGRGGWRAAHGVSILAPCRHELSLAA